MGNIKKRKWTKETAMDWVLKVRSGKEIRGLKFLSACDFLGISPNA